MDRYGGGGGGARRVCETGIRSVGRVGIECTCELRDILVVVLDGSAKDHTCTYGLVAYLNGRLFTRSEVVPSYLKEVSSHRAEAGGLLGALEVAVTLHNRGVQFSAVQIVADNPNPNHYN